MKDFGICLFFAAVGIHAGEGFMKISSNTTVGCGFFMVLLLHLFH
jgi:uncharacterized transporter YbjL